MLYANMYMILLDTAVVVVLLISLGTLANPFKAISKFIQNLIFSRSFLLTFAALVAILICDNYELMLEQHMNYKANFTHWFYSIEGNFVADFQHLFHALWLTPILAFFYVIVFQSLLIASIVIYSYRDPSKKLFYALCYAVIIIYLVAFPFYLFFPIDEVWSFNPKVHFYMLEAFPNFQTWYRGLSGINNCFPSLHTAISVTIAIVASRSGYRLWAWITGISAATIIFAIFYLGIHWLTDMLAGLVLAFFASKFAFKLAERQVAAETRRAKLRAKLDEQ